MVNCYGYCHLAGVYLPRVWWTSKAIVALSQSQANISNLRYGTGKRD